jgi:uncharacterized membrane protein
MIRTIHTYKRLIIAVIIGLIGGGAMALAGLWRLAPVVAWDITMLVFITWVWLVIWRMAPGQTKAHAVREDPGRATADVVLLVASLASLAAVVFLILSASQLSGSERALNLTIGLATVVMSWFLVHTLYTLNYARIYYSGTPGGVDFNQSTPPQYTDFAYLAFTLGMTFQVSDTNVTAKELRIAILRHTLLSYLFGTVIIATTINTLASLSQ